MGQASGNQDGHDPGTERPYTIDQLYQDMGQEQSDQSANSQQKQTTPQRTETCGETAWPVSGSLDPPPTADWRLQAAIYAAHIRLLEEVAKVSDRCGPEPHRRWGCYEALASSSELLRINTEPLFTPDGYGDTASDVAAALRTAARERYILEANLEDLAIDDEPELFSERVSAYESVATIRACAETMRRLHHERTAEASPEKARRLCQAILEVHNHAEVTWRWIEMEENVNDADEMAQATLAWTECLRLRTDEVGFWSDGLDATVVSATMKGVSKKEREQLTSRRVDPTGFVAGLARTKGAGSFIPCRRRRDVIPYVIFSHERKRYVQAVEDPMPATVPTSLYRAQLNACEALIDQLSMREDERRAIRTKLKTAIEDVDAQVAHIDASGRRALGRWSERAGLPAGMAAELIVHALEGHGPAAERMARDMRVRSPRPKRRDAKAIIARAKKSGMDSHQLTLMAEAMGWSDPKGLGITRYRPRKNDIENGAREARAAGLPEPAISRLREKMREWKQCH